MEGVCDWCASVVLGMSIGDWARGPVVLWRSEVLAVERILGTRRAE